MTSRSSAPLPELKASRTDLPSMLFFEHLAELRKRTIISLVALVGLFMLALAFANDILNYLKQPLIQALPHGSQPTLYYTGPMDVFMAQMKVAFVAAVVVGCPFWFFQLWQFVAPGLYNREKTHVIPFTVAASSLFISGAAFCFYVMTPMMLKMLIGIGSMVGTPIITITDYLSMILTLLFTFGVLFETPLILIILGLTGLLTAHQLATHRRAVILGILIVSALLSPSPDVISQLMMAIPGYLLYEFSILAIKLLT